MTTDKKDKETLLNSFEHVALWQKYLRLHRAIPNHKKVLSTMIKFEVMYRPIVKPPFYPDPFGHIAGTNEIRRYKRVKLQLAKRELITTFDTVMGKKLVVTSRGHKVLYEDIPLAKLREKPWDKTWTIVMYDFPETERETRRLTREKLIKLGFGSPQLSILVSPLPIEGPIQKLLESNEVANRAWVVQAKRFLGMDNVELAQKSWPVVKDLQHLYDDLIRTLPRAKKDPNIRPQWQTYFLAANSADPYLPQEILPADWQGIRCEKEFVKLGPAGLLKALLRKIG